MVGFLDKKFKKIGFNKICENTDVYYERYNGKYKIVQILALINTEKGYYIIKSYDKYSEQSVGLTIYEINLCLKKIKEKERKWLEILKLN